MRVVVFESRLSGPLGELVQRHGGEPLRAPALREVPLESNAAALEFARRLRAGEFDVVIFLTGVGTRYLAQLIERDTSREDWVGSLGRCEVVARGPKSVAALRELGARVDVQVPEPNTWNEVLNTLDERRSLEGTRIAVQEYGKPNTDLLAGLEQRGGTVTRVPVYRWALPEDIGPLQEGCRALAEGRAGAALFTSAQQIVHLFQIGSDHGHEDSLRDALGARVVIGSIGPTTTEALLEHGLMADIEPEHPKMGHLAAALAARWRDVPKAIPASAFGAVADPGRESRP